MLATNLKRHSSRGQILLDMALKKAKRADDPQRVTATHRPVVEPCRATAAATRPLMEPRRATAAATRPVMEPRRATAAATHQVVEPRRATVAATQVVEPHRATAAATRPVVDPRRATAAATNRVVESCRATAAATRPVMEPRRATAAATHRVVEPRRATAAATRPVMEPRRATAAATHRVAEPCRATVATTPEVEPHRVTAATLPEVEPHRLTVATTPEVEPHRVTVATAPEVKPHRVTAAITPEVEPHRVTVATSKAGPPIQKSTSIIIATPRTHLPTRDIIDHPVVVERLHFQEPVTFTSIIESDSKSSQMSDADSPLEDSDLDETYTPAKEEDSSDTRESEQEEERRVEQRAQEEADEDIETRPKRKKGVNHRNENVENRQNGKEYKAKKKMGRRTIQVTPRPRLIGNRCNHGFNDGQTRNKGGRKCQDISEEQRQQIFSDFWKMTWGQRKVFVSSQVESTPTKRRTTEVQSRKSLSYKYRLQVNNKQVPVCQTMFLSTLNIGAWSVHKWAKSDMAMHQVKQPVPSKSRRQQDGSAREFLESLPKVESHYCRRDTTKIYLEPVFKHILLPVQGIQDILWRT